MEVGLGGSLRHSHDVPRFTQWPTNPVCRLSWLPALIALLLLPPGAAAQALEVCAEKKKRILLIQQEIKADPVNQKRTGMLEPH